MRTFLTYTSGQSMLQFSLVDEALPSVPRWDRTHNAPILSRLPLPIRARTSAHGAGVRASSAQIIACASPSKNVVLGVTICSIGCPATSARQEPRRDDAAPDNAPACDDTPPGHDPGNARRSARCRP